MGGEKNKLHAIADRGVLATYKKQFLLEKSAIPLWQEKYRNMD